MPNPLEHELLIPLDVCDHHLKAFASRLLQMSIVCPDAYAACILGMSLQPKEVHTQVEVAWRQVTQRSLAIHDKDLVPRT